MGISDQKINANSHLGIRVLTIPLAIQSSQTGYAFYRDVIGFPFEITRVRFYCTSFTNLTNVDVQIGTTSVLTAAIAPTADTSIAGVLSTTFANTYSTSTTSILSALFTSGGSAACVNGVIRIDFRPYPVGGYR